MLDSMIFTILPGVEVWMFLFWDSEF